ncbi:MAG: hypothetical protein EBZ78_11565, partial [Verrucomicrobia bacterium]|nr:hypothetical protein [Verrucomicrobiota bacterium]
MSATSGGTYASTLSLMPSSGVVTTTFYVRIAASTLASTPTGTLTLSTAGLVNTSVDLNAFRLVFTNVGTNRFTMPSHVTKVDLLVVGGGGGGGADMGGGGGGGGVIYRQDYDVLPGTQYSAVVGAGGRGAAPHPIPLEISAAQSGGNSVFGNGSATITALGGGRGGSGHRNDNGGTTIAAAVGGSGGGGAGNTARGGGPAAAGTAGQGFAGSSSAGDWYPGGGGGAGGAGSSNPANGGPGLLVPILGRDLYWGGGGGGSGYSVSGGNGGIGGGGGGAI